MAGKILVAGGTGTLGRAVVASTGVGELAGTEIVVASRRPRPAEPTPYIWATVDYASGQGLEAALDGVDTIIHCANDQKQVGPDRALIDAARRTGVGHFVFISIVGIDRLRFGYYRRKLAVERLLQSSGVPWTILRATQFHDLAAMLCRQLSRPPVAFAPTFALQPIDVRDVADRLVELAAAGPAGRVPDMGGPQVLGVAELMRTYLAAHGRRRAIVPLWLPGKVFHDLRQGYQLTPDRAVGRVTFADYLAEPETANR